MVKYQINHHEILRQLQAQIVETKQDLWFIEVNHIDELAGLNLHCQETELVFISKSDSLIFELLIFEPVYFLRSAHLTEDIQKLNELLKKRMVIPLLIKCGNVNVNINQKSIIYIESLAHYLIFHTASGVYKSRAKISDYEEKLRTDFIRIHKSYLVNKHEIKEIGTDHLSLKNCQDKLPIGRSYRENLKKADKY